MTDTPVLFVLSSDWHSTEINPGIDCSLPGIYRWEIEGVGTYIGKFTSISRPQRQYARNVERFLNNKPYRLHKPDGYRRIHRELADAVKKGRKVKLTIMENCEASNLNAREQELIVSEAANLNDAAGKKASADRQMSGLAAEFFVAAELLKRGLQASLTFGNAKAFDLFASCSETGRTFKVQVKGLRSPGDFYLRPEKVEKGLIYVFALLNKPGVPVNYFIVPGEMLICDQDKFGNFFRKDYSSAGVSSKSPELARYAEKWDIFTALVETETK